MPAKYRSSEKIKDRQTGKIKINHYYVKQATPQTLIDVLNKGRPKQRTKIINEFTRRGIEVKYTTDVLDPKKRTYELISALTDTL
jgi:hypothetical protein